MLSFDELRPATRVRGLIATADVTIVAVTPQGESTVKVVYETDDGDLGSLVIGAEQLANCEIAADRRWSFDGDPLDFKLATEARRIQLAHLFDPFAAVGSSAIQQLPHQIDAVYNRLLPMQPLRFLLADDPGAGKTIMSGLFIRELMLRGDLERCLIIAPGSLVEQWQEELADKFQLRFDIMSRDMVEAALTGNPFQERNLLIARLDQLARNEDLQAKLEASEWDLVIFDEAHKLSARQWSNEVKKTQRYRLAEMVREHTRNLLLLTATPHNGSPTDFLLFLSLLDPDRFAGKLRNNEEVPDVSDVMRRLVKENLLTFDGKRLFRERRATTVTYELTPQEMALYERVSDYVRHQMGKAEQMMEGADKRRGLAVGFALAALQRRLASSPHAIHRSLERRLEKLKVKHLDASFGRTTLTAPVSAKLAIDVTNFDSDDFAGDEFDELEEEAIETAVSAESLQELAAEIEELKGLVELARQVRASGVDRKWVELASILQSDEFSAPGESRKLIVFSEHKDTLDYLVSKTRTLFGSDEAVVCIHGGMRREDRRAVQDAFRNDPHVRVLVATDAAGEGVNLQRANLMVNYDLPWNPNRIEQRFGRIHRIGQDQICHLWNLVAANTREGDVFTKLFAKIEEQRKAFGDQVYDVLGDSEINRSLQELLLEAIRYGKDPKVLAKVDEVINAQIGERLKDVIDERALDSGVLESTNVRRIRHLMEEALARKLQPGFIQAFTEASLDRTGGRLARRPGGRFEITRVPKTVRAHRTHGGPSSFVAQRYERVTFDPATVAPAPTDELQIRADLIAPGHPLLDALITTVLHECEEALGNGTVLVDENDHSNNLKVVFAYEHSITDGHITRNERRAVSRRFQYVAVDENGTVSDPGAEPFLNFGMADETVRKLIEELPADRSLDWVSRVAVPTATAWVTDNLALPHRHEVAELVVSRVERTKAAVRTRLDSEIRYWDRRAAEIKEKELHGQKVKGSSGAARQRADELEARRDRRLRELDAEADLQNHAPTVVAAALVVPRGLIEKSMGGQPSVPDQELIEDTDRRAVAAVLAAERVLGRVPVEQAHNNPGFDILSEDPQTGVVYQIEVKGHRPGTTEVKVNATQIRQGKQNVERFRLAIVAVPEDESAPPVVKYLLDPFHDVSISLATASMSFSVAKLTQFAQEPC